VAIYRDGTLIARKGDTAPGAESGVNLSSFYNTKVVINNNGQVAFLANLTGTGVTSGNDSGLYLSDGNETIQAARKGNTLAGSTVSSLSSVDYFIPSWPGKGFNDYGQIAYQATLADGRSGVFLFTPELHWRSVAGGSWDSAANWTVGLNPAQVHEVFIDPANGLTVTGPSSDTTIKRLAVGATTGTTTLDLGGAGLLRVTNRVNVRSNGRIFMNGGSMIVGTGAATPVADTLHVTAGGFLAGDGRVVGDVINAGGIVVPGASPGELVIEGDYTLGIDGRLIIEIAGTGIGEYDVLNILGTAIFDVGSTIDLKFINGFAPSTDDTFDFLKAYAFSGDMNLLNFNIFGLEPGFDFTTGFTDAGTFSMTALTDGVSSVPIPGAVWMFGSGLLALIGFARRKAA
jgi:hypothetical protein